MLEATRGGGKSSRPRAWKAAKYTASSPGSSFIIAAGRARRSRISTKPGGLICNPNRLLLEERASARRGSLADCLRSLPTPQADRFRRRVFFFLLLFFDGDSPIGWIVGAPTVSQIAGRSAARNFTRRRGSCASNIGRSRAPECAPEICIPSEWPSSRVVEPTTLTSSSSSREDDDERRPN